MSLSHAKLLEEDNRIKEGKSLLLAALEEHSRKITEVKAAEPALKQNYDESIEAMKKLRGGKLWYPYIGSGLGNGALVELADGSVKYDMICGIGPHYWGHSHPDITAAAIDASLADISLQGNLQQNSDTLPLLELLTQASGLDHCFLTTTGAMACENGLKILFQKKHPAKRILAFEKCFMGRTLALSQVTDKAAYRSGLPATITVDYLPFYDAEDPEGSIQRTLSTLKKLLERYPGEYAAICLELVQGEGGFFPGSHDFFKAILSLAKQQGIGILVDEVQSFGRTPQLFAFQHFKLEEYVDVVTIGKLSQICATLFRKELAPRPGLLSQTFTSSTTAIHTAQFMIKKLLSDDFFGEEGKIVQLHKRFSSHFERLSNYFPTLFEGPFGIGTMVAFTVFEGDKEKTLEFIHLLYEKGVIGFVAGLNPMRVRFLPPVGCMSDKDVDNVMEIVEKTLEELSQKPLELSKR